MKILDRYILNEFVKMFLLILASLVALYLIVDFFERIRMFLSKNASMGQMASYFLLTIPMILSQMIPVAVLLGSLMSFGILSKNSEITAIKANGLSLYRLSLPVIVASSVICIAAFLLSEFVTPHTNQKAKYVKLVEIQKKGQMGSFKQNEIWYRGEQGIYNFSMFDPHTHTLRGIRIHFFEHNSPGSMRLSQRIDAKEAVWANDRWEFRDLIITTFSRDGIPSIKRVASRTIPLSEEPSDFMVVQKDTEEMGLLELRRYTKKMRSEGYDTVRYQTDMHGKIAFPLVSIILAILGISFSLKSERSGGIAQSIGLGIVIGFSYWIVFAFAVSLGRAGTLPPVIAGWAANLVVGVAATILFIRVKT